MVSNEDDDYMITTYDNNLNPFTDFIGWWKEDLRLGYNTCGVLARFAETSSNFSDDQNEKEIDRATNEVLRLFPLIFRKVTRKDFASAG